MSNPNAKGKKSNASMPYSSHRQVQVRPTDVDTLIVDDNESFSPAPPCPGSKDSSDASSVSDAFTMTDKTFSQHLKDEIISAIRKEIQVMLEKVSDTGNSLCSKCAAVQENSTQRDASQKRDEFLDNKSDPGRGANKRHVSNQQYPIAGGDTTWYLPISQSEKLFKYGSAIHLVPRGSIKLQSDFLRRRNTMPENLEHEAGSDYKFTARRGVSHYKPDERECLANALQKSVVELVDNVIFKGSELPDYLLEEKCLTDNESIRCRKYADPKDQVRMVLSLIKGRDLDVLKRFLKQIKSHNEYVGNIIEKQFEENKKQGLKSPHCALCKLIQRVDLKYIADILYKHFLLDDGLYNTIFQTELPVGAQKCVWHEVVECLNLHCEERRDVVKEKLIDALVHKDHYKQLAKEIECMINKEHELVCQCRMKFIRPVGNSTLSLVSSRSPHTSTTDETRSVTVVTELESSDAEGHSNQSVQPLDNSRQRFSQWKYRHNEETRQNGETRQVDQQNHVKTLVAEFQKMIPEHSTEDFKFTSQQSNSTSSEHVVMRNRNEMRTSDEEVQDYVRNKPIKSKRKGIHNSDELRLGIVSEIMNV